jgi:hypothetical protein
VAFTCGGGHRHPKGGAPGNVSVELPDPTSTLPVLGLKCYEDSLDALVCAWVGVKYLAGDAVPYGNDIAAIWVP